MYMQQCINLQNSELEKENMENPMKISNWWDDNKNAASVRQTKMIEWITIVAEKNYQVNPTYNATTYVLIDYIEEKFSYKEQDIYFL